MSSSLVSSAGWSAGRDRTPHHHRFSSSFSPALFTALLVLCLVSVAQPAAARLERQTYVYYRTPHLCPYDIMEAVSCGDAKPMCCVASSAIRCCAATTTCGNCTDVVVGYEMPRSSVILGCFSLSVLVLLGSIIMSGVGRHLAWVVERRRVIENYRKRLALRRAEAREYKKELAETEQKDIEDSVACVICCARHIDVALTPCGHVCCCRFCAKRLQECPVCRAAVQRCFDLPLYYVKQLVKAAAEERDGGCGTADVAMMATVPAAAAAAAASGQADEFHVTEEIDSMIDSDGNSDGDEPDESEAALTREDLEAEQRRQRRRRRLQRGSDTSRRSCATPALGADVDAASASGLSSAVRFNRFRSKLYTSLMNTADDDDDGAGAAATQHAGEGDCGARSIVSSPPPAAGGTYAAPMPALSPVRVDARSSTDAAVRAACDETHSSLASAPCRDGFISVEK